MDERRWRFGVVVRGGGRENSSTNALTLCAARGQRFSEEEEDVLVSPLSRARKETVHWRVKDREKALFFLAGLL